MAGSFIMREKFWDTQTHRKESHVDYGGRDWSNAAISQQHPEWPTAARGKEETKRFFPRASRGILFLLTLWFQTSSFQNSEATIFCCFKPLSCGNFLIAIRNKYIGQKNVCFPQVSFFCLRASGTSSLTTFASLGYQKEMRESNKLKPYSKK